MLNQVLCLDGSSRAVSRRSSPSRALTSTLTLHDGSSRLPTTEDFVVYVAQLDGDPTKYLPKR